MAKLICYLFFAFTLLVSFEFKANQQFADNHSVFSDDLSQLDISFRLLKTESTDLDLLHHKSQITRLEYLSSPVNRYESSPRPDYIRNGIAIRAPPLVS